MQKNPFSQLLHGLFPLRRATIKVFGGGLLLLLITTEVISRFVLGFGDPPLALNDDKIEYYLKPSMTYQRFGNAISVNAFGMRGPELSPEKESPDELRILVVGDSVVYGGHRVDQTAIATTILPRLLEAALNRPVVVANIAASSWGPPNMLAYLDRFGTFDADIAILVLSSHDVVDVPVFVPSTQPYWGQPPWCATEDALVSIYDRVFALRVRRQRQATSHVPMEARHAQSLEAATGLLKRFVADNIQPFVALHLEVPELKGTPMSGHGDFLALAVANGVPVIELGPPMKAALQRGESPYSDIIHPSAQGMQVMAQTFADTILTWESTRPH